MNSSPDKAADVPSASGAPPDLPTLPDYAAGLRWALGFYGLAAMITGVLALASWFMLLPGLILLPVGVLLLAARGRLPLQTRLDLAPFFRVLAVAAWFGGGAITLGGAGLFGWHIWNAGRLARSLSVWFGS